MSRHGLILAFCISLLIQGTVFSAEVDTYLDNKNFADFKEGVKLLRENNLRKALASFRNSLDSDFILRDYSHLFISVLLKRENKFKKSLEHLRDIERLDYPSTVIRSKRLFGQIYLEHGFLKESFSSFDYYYGRHAMDRSASSIFSDFTDSYIALPLGDETNYTYLNYFLSFLKANSASQGADKPALLDDIVYASGQGFKQLKVNETATSPDYVFERLRQDLLWQDSFRAGRLEWMKSIAQQKKDYGLKLKVLKQVRDIAANNSERAKLDFMIGLALINMNREREAINYFSAAVKASKGKFLAAKANYYIGRSYEFIGNLPKAAFYYRSVKNSRARTEDEVNLTIKSISRAAWVNYSVGNYKRASLDFEYVQKKFRNRVSEEGYSYWYGKTLLKLGLKSKAKDIFESYYSDFPVSYYGLLCAVELKKVFSMDVELKQFTIADFVNKISEKNRTLTQRALLLFIAGLQDFAQEEVMRIKVNYRNTKELYIIATLYMLLDMPRKTISLVDFLINRKVGIPDEDILKIYYPLKFMDLIESFAKSAQIDPYMIISLIRQESVFHVKAISRANAMGLMQLMPSLGIKLARSLELGELTKDELLDPETNIKLGITHFAKLMKNFESNFIYSIAAYNSSEKKVKEWKSRFKTENIYEFIENIPYFETRKYVKMNIRNYLNYQRIYTDRDWQESLP